MQYYIKRYRNCVVIVLSGEIDRVDVISFSSFIRSLDIDDFKTVILDIDNLEFSREMFYPVAVINSVKKEADRRECFFKLKCSRVEFINYLRGTGLDRIFKPEEFDSSYFEEYEGELQLC